MFTNPIYWFRGGCKDRELGNEHPSWTLEDFKREMSDKEAQECYDEYMRGFKGTPTLIEKVSD